MADRATKRAEPAPPAQARWVNNIVERGEADPRLLTPNPQNWRRHPKAQKDAMSGAMEEIGWIQQVIVNKTTGHVIDGHLRVELAIAHGEPSIPVGYVELTVAQEQLALTLVDPLAAMAQADTEVLASLLETAHPQDTRVRTMLQGLAVEYALVPEDGSGPNGTTRRGGSSTGDEDDDGAEGMDTNPIPAPGSQIHMAQIFLTEETWPEFKAHVDRLREVYALDTMTDTIVECLRRSVEALSPLES